MSGEKRQFLTSAHKFIPHKRIRYNIQPTTHDDAINNKRKSQLTTTVIRPIKKARSSYDGVNQYESNGSILTKVMYSKDEVDRILSDRDNIIRAIKAREEQSVRYLKEENERLREQICKLVRGDTDILLSYNYCQ